MTTPIGQPYERAEARAPSRTACFPPPREVSPARRGRGDPGNSTSPAMSGVHRRPSEERDGDASRSARTTVQVELAPQKSDAFAHRDEPEPAAAGGVGDRGRRVEPLAVVFDRERDPLVPIEELDPHPSCA